jgi:hypothetical protein
METLLASEPVHRKLTCNINYLPLLKNNLMRVSYLIVIICNFAVVTYVYLHCVPDGDAEAGGDEQDGSTHMVVPKRSSCLLRVVANDVGWPEVQLLTLV